MTNSSHPLHFSIVRIYDTNGDIAGAGFLVSNHLVCTCAHVIADIFNIPYEAPSPPHQEVHIDFPFLAGVKGTASIYAWEPIKSNDNGGDIAILRLMSDPPTLAQPARLLPPISTLSGKAFMACGFPNRMDEGQYAYGILRDRLANQYVQLEGTTAQGYRVQRGYSGTPVWDQQGRGVVGMVVAEDHNTETKVAFLIPNDLILKVCPEIKPVTIRQLFAPLTNGLIGLPGNPLSGVEGFLHIYLGTSDKPVPFGGRHKQLEALDRWLLTSDQPYALLVDDAGRGKSALLAQWVATIADEHRADVAFIPISIRFGTSLKSIAISLLGARLRHLHSVKADLPLDTKGWLDEIEMYLREDRFSGPPLLIVLDGADETTDWAIGQDLRFPPEPGHGVKVLISARALADCDVAGWSRRLEWRGEEMRVELPLLDRSQVAEVLQSMGNPLAGLITQVDVVRELHRLSGGDPLLIQLYVEALRGAGERTAFITPENLGNLQPGLKDYFKQWWNDQRDQWGSSAPLKEKTVRTLLNVMSCELGPLSIDDLLALTEPEQFDSWTVEDALRPLARFVVGNGKEQGYVFSHPRLNQYFYEKLSQRERQDWEQRFLNYGRQTLEALTRSKRDPSKVSSYIVRYYGVHLERSNAAPEYFNDLICQEWQQAWDALEGTYDGFLSDLIRAWKQADAAGELAQDTHERNRAIGWQCRYALIATSIKSQMGNIPLKLLVSLVSKGAWTPIQGLASARHIPHEDQKARALVALAPYLSTPLLQDAVELVRTIGDEKHQAETLIGLVPYLSLPLLQDTVEIAQAIHDEETRALALTGLASHLSAHLKNTALHDAVEAARAIPFAEHRALALGELAFYLQNPQQNIVLHDAMETIRAISFASSQARALVKLMPRLEDLSHRKEALKIAQDLADKGHRAQTLASLAPYLPTPLQARVLQDAIDTAQAIPDEEARAQVLVELAPYLSISLLQDAVDAVQAIPDEETRARALIELAPHLSAPLLQNAVEAAQAITNEENRAYVFTNLVPHLAKLGHKMEAMDITRAIPFEEIQAQALIELAPHLSAPLLLEALKTARAITDEESRTLALMGLAPHLSEPPHNAALHDAVEAARAITDEESRVQVLTDLVPYLPVPLQNRALHNAIEEAQAISFMRSRARALTSLSPYLSTPLLQEAVKVNRSLDDEELLEHVYADLVSRLGDLGYEKEAMETAQAIKGEESRAQALTRLVPHLSEPLKNIAVHDAVEAARAIPFAEIRARAFIELAPYLSAPLLQEAMEAAQSVSFEESRAEVLISLAPHLSAPLQAIAVRNAIEAFSAIPDKERQESTYTELVPRLGDLGYEKEAMEVARAILFAMNRALALKKLAPYLSLPLLQDAIEVARAINDEWLQAMALTGLVPRLGNLGGKDEAMKMAQAIPLVELRITALVNLSPHLPESLQIVALRDAVKAIHAISTEQGQARTLAGLASYLSKSLLQDAMEKAQALTGQTSRLQALIGLIPYLSEPLRNAALQDAMETVRAIHSEREQAEALTSLAPYLSLSLLQDAMKTVQAIHSERKQTEALTDSGPYLSKKSLFEGAMESVRDRADEESRIGALTGLVIRLGELGHEMEAVKAVHTISTEQGQARTLAGLAPYLSKSLLQDAMEKAQALTGQTSRLQALIGLIPYLSEPLRNAALQDAMETVRAIHSEREQAEALTNLAPYLSLSLLQDAMEVAKTLSNEESRTQALTNLAPYVKQLPVDRLYPLWCQIIHVLASRTRSNLLSDIQALASIITTLGEKETLIATMQAIIEIGKWFP